MPSIERLPWQTCGAITLISDVRRLTGTSANVKGQPAHLRRRSSPCQDGLSLGIRHCSSPMAKRRRPPRETSAVSLVPNTTKPTEISRAHKCAAGDETATRLHNRESKNNKDPGIERLVWGPVDCRACSVSISSPLDLKDPRRTNLRRDGYLRWQGRL